MRTIGKHWPKNSPPGDFSALCDICGARWRRSQLWRNEDGMLVCRDEGRGRSVRALSDLNTADTTPAQLPPVDGTLDTFNHLAPPGSWRGTL